MVGCCDATRVTMCFSTEVDTGNDGRIDDGIDEILAESEAITWLSWFVFFLS